MTKAEKFLKGWVKRNIHSAPEEMQHQSPDSVLSNLRMDADDAGVGDRSLLEAAGGDLLQFVQKEMMNAHRT